MKPNAFDRRTPSDEMLTRRRAWRVDQVHFQVIARDGEHRYDVELQPSGDLTCTCTAASFSRPCWHEERVARRLLREGIPDGALVADSLGAASEEVAW